LGADKSSILENAQLLASRGQFDKAIAEWKKLATGSPADGNIFNTIGDLHLKRNAPADAIDAYFQAAAAFKAGDAAIKAAALYKKILKLDPNRTQAYQHLGDLNARRGLVTDAVADYLALAKLYVKAGKRQEALEAYRAVAKLDAANVEATQRIAELAPPEEQAAGGAQEQAASSPGDSSARAGLKLPSAAPRPDPSVHTGPVSPPPSSPTAEPAKGSRDWTREDWIQEALKQTAAGQYTEAESVLMELLGKEPGDPEVCRLLASLHLKRGEFSGAKAEFRFLAEAALRALDFKLAQAMLVEYLNADAACVELRELLARAYEQSGDLGTATAQYGQALETLLSHPDPELPSLPSELYAKIVELAPASPLVGQFAHAFNRQQESKPAVQPEPAAPAVEPASPVAAAAPVTQAAPTFKFAPAAPEPEPGDHEEAAGLQEPAATVEDAEEPAVAQGHGAVPAQDDAAGETVSEESLVEAGDQEGTEPAGWEPPLEPDYGAHYELGVAYRNMGLQDEAIEEFQVATGGSECFLDACRMLATCLTDRKMNRPAIESLEQALADPRCKGAEADLIRYELGRLYEAEGQDGSALQVYSQIPSFRDVPRRLERITGSSEPVPSTVGGPPAAGEGHAPGRKKRKISYL
jgi:tetratricopeptide (TPR) repeat protein